MNGQEGTPNPDIPGPVPGCPDDNAGAKPGAAASEHLGGTDLPQGKRKPVFLVLALALAVAGICGFLWLFIRDFNVYWLILSPIIIALYQIPAVFFFWLYKRSGAGTAPIPACPEDPAR